MILSKEILTEFYVNQKLSIYEIATKTGISKSTIHRKLKAYGIPRRSYREAFQLRDSRGNCWHYKKDVPMNPNLAYILGVLFGDGFARRRTQGGHVIGMSVGDKEFAEAFANNVRALGFRIKIKKYGPYHENRKPRYRALFYSTKFYYWFKQLSVNKLENLIESKDLVVAFVKGFYESEGTLGESRKWYYLRLSNTNKELLMLVQRFLIKLGYNFKFYGPYKKRLGTKPFYRLHLGNKEQIINFLKVIKPCVKNKLC